jgi:hypothetical protein
MQKEAKKQSPDKRKLIQPILRRRTKRMVSRRLEGRVIKLKIESLHEVMFVLNTKIKKNWPNLQDLGLAIQRQLETNLPNLPAMWKIN